jgi:hypothetical protein
MPEDFAKKQFPGVGRRKSLLQNPGDARGTETHPRLQIAEGLVPNPSSLLPSSPSAAKPTRWHCQGPKPAPIPRQCSAKAASRSLALGSLMLIHPKPTPCSCPGREESWPAHSPQSRTSQVEPVTHSLRATAKWPLWLTGKSSAPTASLTHLPSWPLICPLPQPSA